MLERVLGPCGSRRTDRISSDASVRRAPPPAADPIGTDTIFPLEVHRDAPGVARGIGPRLRRLRTGKTPEPPPQPDMRHQVRLCVGGFDHLPDYVPDEADAAAGKAKRTGARVRGTTQTPAPRKPSSVTRPPLPPAAPAPAASVAMPNLRAGMDYREAHTDPEAAEVAASLAKMRADLPGFHAAFDGRHVVNETALLAAAERRIERDVHMYALYHLYAGPTAHAAYGDLPAMRPIVSTKSRITDRFASLLGMRRAKNPLPEPQTLLRAVDATVDGRDAPEIASLDGGLAARLASFRHHAERTTLFGEDRPTEEQARRGVVRAARRVAKRLPLLEAYRAEQRTGVGGSATAAFRAAAERDGRKTVERYASLRAQARAFAERGIPILRLETPARDEIRRYLDARRPGRKTVGDTEVCRLPRAAPEQPSTMLEPRRATELRAAPERSATASFVEAMRTTPTLSPDRGADATRRSTHVPAATNGVGFVAAEDAKVGKPVDGNRNVPNGLSPAAKIDGASA